MDVNIFELLIANLYRLDEKEEADRTGVFQTLGACTFPLSHVNTCTYDRLTEPHYDRPTFLSLGIFENLLSFDPALAETLVKSTTVVKWVLDRILVKEYDSNKQYASEVSPVSALTCLES